MTEGEWRAAIIAAKVALDNMPLELTNESIADYRGAIAALDKAVFQGFRLLHEKWKREFKPEPHTFTLEDLGL